MYLWLLNIIRDTPKRFGRIIGAIMEIETITDVKRLGIWLHTAGAYVFDLVGGPELVQFLIRNLTSNRSLTSQEMETARSVLGENAIRYKDVRVADRGFLLFVFGLNRRRAFATWHTINVPADRWQNLPLIIHELTHVLQYEKVGSVYIGQGLGAQFRLGPGAYDYGGTEGLTAAMAAGKHYSDYNREQQGQIAQDYCQRWLEGLMTATYEPFIEELRAGAV